MIRLATIDDVPDITRIYNQAIDAGFQTAFTEKLTPENRAEWLSSHLSAGYPVFVYQAGSEVVGWLSVSAYRPGRAALQHTVEISYFVDALHQGRGVGAAMLAHAIDACRELKYKVALAIIIDRNMASIRLIEKFGFEKWGFLPGVISFRGEECGQVYYGKALSQ